MAPRYRSTLHIWIEPYRTPTVVPADNFNASLDGQNLRKAMKGFGCNDDQLIEILTNRSNKQRQKIQLYYNSVQCRCPYRDIKKITSGELKKLYLALFVPTLDYYCDQIHEALSGIRTQEDTLIEYFCGLEKDLIRKITQNYRQKFKRAIERDISLNVRDKLKKIFIALASGERDDEDPVQEIDVEAAKKDAEDLLPLEEFNIDSSRRALFQILTRRSYSQICEINRQYKNFGGLSLEDTIDRQFSGSLRDSVQSIFQCMINPAKFFATLLHKSMAGMKLNNTVLIRVIVSRCEIDMGDIKKAFHELCNRELEDFIRSQTAGSYCKSLLALIQET